jgi:hypothetical protein
MLLLRRPLRFKAPVAAASAGGRIASGVTASEEKVLTGRNPRFELPARFTGSTLLQHELRELAGWIPPVGQQGRVPLAKLGSEHCFANFRHGCS